MVLQFVNICNSLYACKTSLSPCIIFKHLKLATIQARSRLLPVYCSNNLLPIFFLQKAMIFTVSVNKNYVAYKTLSKQTKVDNVNF